MGLQSALTTSLTGMKAAETTIDVVGNNVANASTVGFKASHVLFATQFLQTQSIGSAPPEDTDAASGNLTGGTNPRQIGLGVKVAAINPDFSQGTIQISSNPLDIAVQGDGFFLVQGLQGEQLYTRSGQFQTNSLNQIVTSTGNLVLGKVATDFVIPENNDNPVPITIPFGDPVRQVTENAFFRGNLAPTADIGTSGVLTSQGLGDALVLPPDAASTDLGLISPPNVGGADATPSTPGVATTLPAGSYSYRVTWYKTEGANTYESPASGIISALAAASLGDQIDLTGLPVDASGDWDGRHLYRSSDGTTFEFLDSIPAIGATYTDDNSPAPTSTVLADTNLQQEEYSYYITFFSTTSGVETRPTELLGPLSVSDPTSRIRIDDLPQPTGAFNRIRIYRNQGNAATEFRLVDDVPAGTTTYIDSKQDGDLGGLIDLLGAKAAATTLLTNVIIRNGDNYTQPFVEGTLTFTGTKGGNQLATKELQIFGAGPNATTVNELRLFLQDAYGIDTSLTDDPAGVRLNSLTGEIEFTSNDGIANEVGADIGAFTMAPASTGQASALAFDFEPTTEATGKGTSTTFVVFDSLGAPVNVRLTTVRIESDPTTEGVTYRWFATSDDNLPTNSADTSVSTFLASGELEFDNQGNLISPSTGIEQISINHPAGEVLAFNLDFNSVNGLTVTDPQGNPVSSMNMTRQDGFPTGTLTSFSVTESGLIRGVYSNGAERPIGQLLMAKFANNTGLLQVGSNLYAAGINSGVPQVNLPGVDGIGSLTAGAVELSNADIGQNLIELILASTQYRGGARVITTTQQLFDELLNIRR
jgi:flagellar hook protein FlgE